MLVQGKANRPVKQNVPEIDSHITGNLVCDWKHRKWVNKVESSINWTQTIGEKWNLISYLY